VITLNFFATGAHVGENLLKTQFVDDAHTFGRDAQADEALFGFQPETVMVQVGEEATARLVVGVGYGVPCDNSLAGDLAYSGHNELPLTQKSPDQAVSGMRKPAIIRDVLSVLKLVALFLCLAATLADDRAHYAAHDFLTEATAHGAHGAFDKGFADGFAGATTLAWCAAAK